MVGSPYESMRRSGLTVVRVLDLVEFSLCYEGFDASH